MSETPENTPVQSSTVTAPTPVSAAGAPHQTPRVFRVAAWVAIAAGTVFIVAVIFFTGFALGRHAGFHGDCPRHGYYKQHAMMMHPHGPGGPGGGGPAALPGGGGPGTPRPGSGPGQAPPGPGR